MKENEGSGSTKLDIDNGEMKEKKRNPTEMQGQYERSQTNERG
jgi:hypothetical protein